MIAYYSKIQTFNGGAPLIEPGTYGALVLPLNGFGGNGAIITDAGIKYNDQYGEGPDLILLPTNEGVNWYSQTLNRKTIKAIKEEVEAIVDRKIIEAIEYRAGYLQFLKTGLV